MGELVFGLQNPHNYLNPSPNLRPSQNDVPNMQVKINEGKVWIGQGMVTVFTSLSPTLVAPAPLTARIDAIGVNATTGNLQVITGTATATPPVVPVQPNKDFYPICLVLLQASTTSLTNQNLIDVREVGNFGQATTWAHNDLSGRSAADCHPESAITGLVADLADRPNTATFNAALATKADVGGTPSEIFVLNTDVTGAPTENGRIQVKRGTAPFNAEIRWNETLDRWELTKSDGSFEPIVFGGSGPLSPILTINSLDEDGTGNFLISAKGGSFTSITAGPAANQISVEDGDWVYWNLPQATVAPTSNIILGTMVVPSGSTVAQVRLGVRRTDDVADATLFSRATQTGVGANTVATSSEGPVVLSLPTPLVATERLGFAVENTDVAAKNVVAIAAALIRRV